MMIIKLEFRNFIFYPRDEVGDIGENLGVFWHAATNIEGSQPDHLKDSIISLYGQRTSGVALDDNAEI